MKAIIMAGGEGTRLRPLTCSMPKPMVPVAGKPTMEHIINLLKTHNITNIASTLHYLPQSIMDYFSDGSRFGINLSYFIEESPLGTGGSVLNAESFLDDTFIVISGDALTDIDLEKAVNYHKAKGAKATLVLKKEPVPLEYGIVITNSEGRIVRFLEKPSWGEVFSDTINTGIYILEPEVFNYYNKGDNFDFSKDLFPKLLKDNVPMFGYITEEYWCDIGDLKSYLQTNFDVLDRKVRINFHVHEKLNGVWIGDNTIISEGAVIEGPCYIGSNCMIKSGSKIGSYSIIGNNNIICESTSIKKSLLWDFNNIGKSNQLRGTIICNKTILKNFTNFFEGSVIGSEATILSNATVKSNIKVWPNKHIEESSVVNKNLVWGTGHSSLVFGSKGISGDINIDITPEVASLLGSAFASVMGKNHPLVLSSDGSSAADLIKEALAVGIISSGGRVINISNIPLFVSRFAASFYKSCGGIHVTHDIHDNNKVYIQFLKGNGGDIDRADEKKIEQLFARQDFERSDAGEIGSNIRVENFSSLYELKGVSLIKNIESIKSKSPNILVASEDSRTLNLMSSFLQSIGCKIHAEGGIIKSSSLNEYLNKFSSDVVKGSYYMGAVIGPDGEGILLVDERGRVIDRDRYTLLSSLLVLKQDIKQLFIPHTSTVIIDEMARSFNAQVKRTKASSSSFINELLDGDTTGELPLQYQLNFDPALALARITDYLAGESISLSALADELPELYLFKDEVYCDFKDRGRIIRQLIDENSNSALELFEGIKLNTNKGWTLVLPDNERPVLKIFVEGYCQEFAEELSSEIRDRLNALTGKN
jgi:mannose-1-phosphate guanylyltransferase / phosphomannomutase